MHFDLILQNKIKTDILYYIIIKIYILLQMSEQWHFIIYWLRKLSETKERYKTYDLKLLIIVETFKQWHYYLKESLYSIKILTNHNNLCDFMKIKSLNKRQIK